MKTKIIAAALFLLSSTQTFAAAYFMPLPNQSLIGEIQYTSGDGESVVNLQKRYNVGFNAMKSANPHVDVEHYLPSTTIQIPTQHLLPNEQRVGIVVNLPEMRMYYYPKGTNKVLTYPIGIGRIGKMIPIEKTSITRKVTNPTWVPPEDIREFNLEQGVVLPKVMPPGPDNPLGPYAIYMKIPTYLIHSTIFPESIGKRASFGCIRMYEDDIQTFFPSIAGGIPVAIVNNPIKVGWQNNSLYVEAHHPLEEHSTAYNSSLPGMVHIISEHSKDEPTFIDWQMVSYIAKERDGIPHEIGMKIPQ